MSRRKPVPTTIERATDELYWRAKILAEVVDGFPKDARTAEPLRRLEYALEDFDASRGVQTAAGPLFGPTEAG